MKYSRILLVVFPLGVLACFCFAVGYLGAWDYAGMERGRLYAIAQDAVRHLYVGMSRAEAQQFMKDAWRHYDCLDGEFDIYLFGSHNMEWTGVVFLQYEEQGDKHVPTEIGKEENYRLFLYDSCAISEK